jgi:DNA (cytosine-5)-methyltransferase 1
MKHLDLFSGIGGFTLACDWVGIETVGFVEIDKFCQKVLQKHWPNIPIADDIKNVKKDTFQNPIDIITGGFPCQDISQANTNNPKGLVGERSGLWNEYKRLVSEIRPRYFIVENTSALLYRGLARVLGDISELGYDAVWEVIPAKEIGAPHRRARVWVVAYTNGNRLFQSMPHRRFEKAEPRKTPIWSEYWNEVRSGFTGYETISSLEETKRAAAIKPWLCRVSDGIPNGLDRLKSLGNSIVPQVAYTLLKTIAINEGIRL